VIEWRGGAARSQNLRGGLQLNEPELTKARITNLEYSVNLISSEVLRNILDFTNLTSPVMTTKNLIRIGGNHDGGYVIAESFEGMVAISLGVGLETQADRDLLGRGFSMVAADGTVANPFPHEGKYDFINKNIGYDSDENKYTTLNYLISERVNRAQIDLLLVDIEGSEYALLTNEIDSVVKAQQIVIEFHGLELFGDANFSTKVIKLLSILRKSHSPIHVHANNDGGIVRLAGAAWPTILEVTFLKKELCTPARNYGPFPTVLDFPNTDKRPDVDLNPFYGAIASFSENCRAILRI